MPLLCFHLPFSNARLTPHFTRRTYCGHRQRGPSKVHAGVRLDAIKDTRQALFFVEKETATNVLLLGAMHYNPQSIALVTNAVDGLAHQGKLAAVVLETCERRWQRTMEIQGTGTILRAVLDNEMQAAAERAKTAGVPVILGDQEARELAPAAAKVLKETVVDFFTPLSGGWSRLQEDIVGGYQRCFTTDGTGLKLGDLFDARLLLGLPVTLVRYPLAFLIKAPNKFIPLVTVLGALAALPSLVPTGEVNVDGDYVASQAELITSGIFFLLDLLEPVVILRLVFITLLQRRNEILASNIREACRLAKGEDDTVVAVVGAAHCNGVKLLLISSEGCCKT